MKNKFIILDRNRGQVTIFIILALILIVVIIILFLLKNPPRAEISDDKNPQMFIESCTEQSVQNALSIISKYGDIPPRASIMYKNNNLTYLCYSSEDYKPCVNQQPKLIEHIQNQINNYIHNNISDCFDSLKLILEKKYNVQMSDMELKTVLRPGEILIQINRKFVMSRDKDVRQFNSFKILINHPLYNLLETSSDIVNQEAQYCNFDSAGFMLTYPNLDISRFKTGESDVIYKVKDRTTQKEYNFATRSCAMPAGL